MTELIEGYSPPTLEKEPEDPKDKDPLTIRIILLCDGTNNNRANIAEREKFELYEKSDSDSYDKFSNVGHGADSSYDNGRTNIAIMEPHVDYGEDNGNYSFVVKMYVEGQGTLAFNKDDTGGLALASGLSGIYQRARTGITDALNLLYSKFLKGKTPEDYFIKQVDVDVFGFSRGAATARHAIHVITSDETVTVDEPSGYGEQATTVNKPFFEHLRTTYGYREMREDQVKIIFAGLYDTVVSFVGSQLMPAWIANNTRDQKAVAKAKFALHLAAADEHRQDFPLHRIKSSLDVNKGAEYYLPGVHSDIGGSYNLANDKLFDKKKNEKTEIRQVLFTGSYEDCLKAEAKLYRAFEGLDIDPTPCGPKLDQFRVRGYRKVTGSEHVRASDEVKIINRGLVSDLKEDKENLIKDGWYKEHELTIATKYWATVARLNPINLILNQSIHSGVLIAKRYGISSGYCNIPLKFMVEHSRKHAIKIDEKLDERIKIILAEVPEFDTVEKRLRLYMGAMGLNGSDPSDWLDVKNAKGIYPGIKRLRNRHLHNSSRWEVSEGIMAVTAPVAELGFTPRFEKIDGVTLRRRFYYEG